MRLSPFLCVLLLLGVWTGVVLADPSSYDEKPWSYPPFAANNVYPEDEGVNNACPGQQIACGDRIEPAALDPAGDLDWFYFDIATAGTLITVGTDAYQGSTTDTYLELRDACTGGILVQDDDGGPGFFSLISNFPAPHAGLYYVKVRGFGTSTVGAYVAFVQCTVPQPPPENDQCSGAFPIERCTSGTLNGDSYLATNNYDPGVPGPSCTGYSASGKDVVYVLNLQAGDITHFVYNQVSADASFYIVSDCSNVSTSCVIGADDGVTGDAETIDWVAPGSGAYYLILDSYTAGYGGAWTLDYEIMCPTQTAVCCVGHTCYLVTEIQCRDLQGNWHPEWTSCGPPNPCDIYTPADPSSWGTIKSIYR